MARCRCFLQDASLARGPASPKRRPCPDTASFALGRSLWLPSVGIQRRAVRIPLPFALGCLRSNYPKYIIIQESEKVPAQ